MEFVSVLVICERMAVFVNA